MEAFAELAPRLARLPRARVLGVEVAVASDLVSRLLGLALLERSAAGAGLWIPGCGSVHTVGMRFELDLLFVGAGGELVRRVDAVRRARIVGCAAAFGVLELPSGNKPQNYDITRDIQRYQVELPHDSHSRDHR